MKPNGLHIAAAVVVVSNVYVAANVARNRGAGPESELTLTECELHMNPPDSDNSFASARIVAEISGKRFDEAQLRDLGFDLSARHERAREVFLALEYAGKTWEEWASIAPDAYYMTGMPEEQRIAIRRGTNTKLFAIDAALDPAVLRARHPNRRQVMILRGRVRMTKESASKTYGTIDGLARLEIDVPSPLSKRLIGAQPGCRYEVGAGNSMRIVEPRFRVTVRTGSRYEPWIESLEYK